VVLNMLRMRLTVPYSQPLKSAPVNVKTLPVDFVINLFVAPHDDAPEKEMAPVYFLAAWILRLTVAVGVMLDI